MKKVIVILLLWLVTQTVQAQIQAVVVEKESKLPIPFVSVTYQSGEVKKVAIADKHGKFTVNEPDVRSIKVTCLSYAPKTVSIPAGFSGQLSIELEEEAFSLREFVVTPKNNPAHRIIRNVMENKDLNNFEKYAEYSYRCYLKSVFDVSIISDSVSVEIDSMAYVTETVTLCSKQGGRSNDKIIANRTSGLESPIFGQLIYGGFYKAISFYNASIPILGESRPDDRMTYEYVTPLSAGSISAYNFQLENVYVQENKTDTIFEITYYPKKNRNFNGLMGTMFISSDGYALTGIIAQPYNKEGVTFRFKQEYAKVDEKWFPSNLEEMMDFGIFPFLNKKSIRVTCFLVSHISDVKYKIDQKLSNRLEKFYLDDDSIRKNRFKFDALRPLPMTNREISFYNRTDSMLRNARKKGFNFDDILNLMTKLPEYKIPIKKIDVDLGRIYSSNKYEKYRLGLGLYTNDEWIKWLSTGGYFGYGTKDKIWKYGGEVKLTLQKSHDLYFKYLYQNTLKESGKPLASNSLEWNENYLRSLIASRFDRVEEHKMEAHYQPFRPLKLKLAFSTKDMNPLYDYIYQNIPVKNYSADDLQFSVRYAFNEKYITMGKERRLLSWGNPIVSISYTRGINQLREKSPLYNKIEATVDIRAYNGHIGQSDLRLAGGYIDRSLPYGLLFTGKGSKDSWISLHISNSFQTMQPYEFLSDKYMHVFYSHNFGKLFLNTKKFAPEWVIAYNVGWGNLANPENHTMIDFSLLNRIYQEGGLIIKNIVKIPFVSSYTFNIGLGGFYRLGQYSFPNWKDNLALKIAYGITF